MGPSKLKPEPEMAQVPELELELEPELAHIFTTILLRVACATLVEKLVPHLAIWLNHFVFLALQRKRHAPRIIFVWMLCHGRR